mmetsp:Transcript_17443/g.24400  ORF Transcript_17443/g.24400 Transcript_17443/m.24400 type:complete len:372 (+) Transcript_17443:567-1682(+)
MIGKFFTELKDHMIVVLTHGDCLRSIDAEKKAPEMWNGVLEKFLGFKPAATVLITNHSRHKTRSGSDRIQCAMKLLKAMGDVVRRAKARKVKPKSVDEKVVMQYIERRIEARGLKKGSVFANIIKILPIIRVFGGGGGCFPANALVRTPHGIAPMCSLRVGDLVLTANSGLELSYDTVTFFGHGQCLIRANFVTLHARLCSGAGSREQLYRLRLTSKHYIPIEDRGALKFIYARDVAMGDRVCVLSERPGGNTNLVWAEIIKIENEMDKGLFNPYTTRGNIVVDGVLASCHSDWILDDMLPSLLSNHLPSFYNWCFKPMHALHHVAGSKVAKLLDLDPPMSRPNGIGTEVFTIAGLATLTMTLATIIHCII